MSVPRISVILPVYNAAPFLGEALDSIFKQTFTDFEIIAIDDGSTDGSAGILRTAAKHDRRLRVVHRENRGLVATLNEAILLAKGEFLARMDADDISLPTRFARQAAALEAHPDVAVCGTWVQTFGVAASDHRLWQLPTEPHRVKAAMLFRCAVAHPTVMMRRSLFSKESLHYDAEYRHAEDYALWANVLAHHAMMNLAEPLFQYRVHAGQVSGVHYETQQALGDRIRGEMLARWSFHPTPRQLRIHAAVSRDRVTDDILPEADAWLCHLMHANETLHVFDRDAFGSVLCGRWVGILRRAREIGVALDIASSPLASFLHEGALDSPRPHGSADKSGMSHRSPM